MANTKAKNDFFTGIEDGLIIGDVLLNDTGKSGLPVVSTTGSWTTANGATVSFQPTGQVTYDPRAAFQYLKAGQTVTEVIDYSITSGGKNDTGTVSFTITGVNDAPTAVTDNFTRTENSITGNVLSNDSDVEGDTLRVSNTGVITSQGGYAVTLSSNGAFSYAASNFQYLRAGQTLTDRFTYYVSDGNGGVSTATANVTITGVNDGPTAVSNTAAATEDGSPVSGNLLANDTDIDGDALSVTTAGTWTTAKGAMITMGANGTYTYGVGGAFQSLGAGQTTTDTISYSISDGNGGTATANLVVTVTGVNDGPVANADTGTTTEDAAVTGNVLANDADVDAGDVLTVTTTGNLATTNGGSVTMAASGAYTYNPGAAFQQLKAGQSAADSFTYSISDGKGGTATSTVIVTVNGVNDAPIVLGESNAALEDGAPVTGNVLSNDSDIDGDGLAIANAGTWTTAKGATVTIGGNGSYSYSVGNAFQSLGAGATTTDAVTYTVADGQGGWRNGTLNVTVTGVNDGPVANNDARTTNEDTLVTGNVLSNDSDVDVGDVLTVTTPGTWTTTGGGSVTMLSNGNYAYDPRAAYQSLTAGQTETDSFTYSISDGKGGTDTATATITISGRNDAPVGTSDVATATEDGGAVSGNLLANDSDPDGDTLLVATAGTFATAKGASITIAANGAYTYTVGAAFQSLAVGQNATDTVTYAVSDGKGGTASANLVVTVSGNNDAPVANPDSATTSEDVPVSGNVLSNDTDVDIGDTRTVGSTGHWTTAGGGLIAMAADGTYSYTPGAAFQYLVAGQSANDSFTYTVADGRGGSATGTVTVTITGANEAPVANADTAAATEDGAPVSGNLLANDTDYEGQTLSVTTTGSRTTALGATVTINADGSYMYAPGMAFQSLGAGETIVDTISYGIKDSTGTASTGVLRVTVTGTNDLPVANADIIAGTEDGLITGFLTANDTDVDGDFLTATSAGVQTSANGTFTILPNGSYTYAPSSSLQSLKAGQTASDSFSYTVSDGHGGTATATATITISGVNDAPVTVGETFSTVSDTPVSGNLLANDFDAEGDALTLTSTGPRSTSGGSVTMNADGSFVYTPNLAFSGADSFNYTVSDGQGGTKTASVTVTVARHGTGPQAIADTATTTEDSSIVGNVLANDTDAEGDTLTVTSTGTQQTAGGGSVTVAANGSYSYNPGAAYQYLKGGETATDSFSYTVTDAINGSSTATVSITVTGTNDDPVAVADSFTAMEDAVITLNVLTNDRDIDGHALSVAAGPIVTAKGVTLSMNANGSFTYAPPADFSGNDSFTYTVIDASGATSSATASVSVTGVADAPTLTAGNVSGQGSIALDISAALVDTDGSETLEIVVSGLEAGSSLSAGTNLGGGRWMLTPNLLPGLSLTPTFGSTSDRLLTVTATSRESTGGIATKSATFTVTNTGESGASNGDDALTGTPGDDNLNGLGGDDVLIGLGGNDRLDGGPGNDTADYSGAAAAVNVKLDGPATGGAGTDTLISIENIIGSGYADTLTGNAGANRLSGKAGNDTIFGDAGDDTIDGGLGNDNIIGSTGYDTIVYSWTTSRVTVDLETGQASGGGGFDNLTGMDNIIGSAFNDVLNGHFGRNIIDGLGGNDVLAGRGGQNFLTGGTGADRFVFAGVGRSDTVTDFSAAEGDLLDFRADFASYDAFLAGVTITTSAGKTEIEYVNHAAHLTLEGVVVPVDRSWFMGW